jgi:hypothetical protein
LFSYREHSILNYLSQQLFLIHRRRFLFAVILAFFAGCIFTGFFSVDSNLAQLENFYNGSDSGNSGD